MASAGTSQANLPPIPRNEAIRFAKDCLEAAGTPPRNALALAECLIQADYMGHTCQGMNKLETYIQEIRNNTNAQAVPRVIKESPAIAWVDGNNGLGVIVSTFCMELAIQKAKIIGIGLVVARGSNSYGIAGLYSLQAARHGLLGLSFTNSSPIVAPTRTSHAALGTNPISLAAPGVNEDVFLLDMATSAVTVGKVEMLSRQHLPVPEDWVNMQTGALRPLGGKEPNSNYKGYGLAMLVEILTGLLAGSGYGYHIRKYGDFHRIADLGQCFIAINPEFFASGFPERMSDLMNHIRHLEPDDPAKPVLIPGDLERQHMAMVDKDGGIRYVQAQLNRCLSLAEEFQVKPMQPLV